MLLHSPPSSLTSAAFCLFPHFLSRLAIVLFLQFPFHLQHYLLFWLIIQHTHVMAQHTVAAECTYETSYRVLLLRSLRNETAVYTITWLPGQPRNQHWIPSNCKILLTRWGPCSLPLNVCRCQSGQRVKLRRSSTSNSEVTTAQTCIFSPRSLLGVTTSYNINGATMHFRGMRS
jgi:hypothetical protein